MTEERRVTQEDLMRARETARERVEANVVTGDIVTASPKEETEE